MKLSFKNEEDQNNQIILIKNIKLRNKSVTNNTHKDFYKNFKKNKIENDNYTKTSQEFFNDHITYENMFKNNYKTILTSHQFNPESTKSSIKNFTPKNNTYSLYPTLETINSLSNRTSYSNFFNSPKTDFKNHLSKLTDEEANILISLYHMNETGKNDNNLKKKYLDKEKKKIFYEKFNLKIDKNCDEIEIINLFLRNNINNLLEKETEKFNKTHYFCHPNFFNNPRKSLSKLKLNTQIFQNLMNQRTFKQIESYKTKYEKEMENIKKIAHMPKIKEIKNDIVLSNRSTKNDNQMEEKPLEITNTETKNIAIKQNFVIPQFLTRTRQISREQLLENVQLHISNEGGTYRPTPRTQFSTTVEGDYIYIFGGINSERCSDIWYYNMKGLKWKQIQIKDENESPVPRAGHTAVLYRKDIYIYGGSTPKEYFKLKEDILIFSTVLNKFYPEKTYNKNEIGWRRNHVAVTVGNHMFVHGGIDAETEKYMSDSHFLDFTKMTWARLDCKGCKPPMLAFHSAVLVSQTSSDSAFNLYKFPEISNNSNNLVKKIKYEGVYLFGGCDDKNIPTNEIRILKIGKKPNEWLIPRTHGYPPSARVGASINFYSNLNLIIIHGGRNDLETICIFNDIFLLDLENLLWIKANFYNSIPIERTYHSSFINGDKMYILGGCSIKTFINFEICTVHLDLYNKKVRADSNVNRSINKEASLHDVQLIEKEENNRILSNKILRPDFIENDKIDKFVVKKDLIKNIFMKSDKLFIKNNI